MSEKINIQDIARLARVSTGTVSRVLNNKPDVNPQTRERILRIVEEQGYVPSSAAIGLVSGRSHLISILVPALTWPLVPEMMLKVAETIESSSYEIVLYSISSSNHLRDCGKVIDRILATRMTAGLLAIFPGQSAQHLTQLQRQGFPVVLIDDQNPPIEGIPWIGADNRGGAYEATRYLIALGHQRIACIQGPMLYKVSRDRYQGYLDALQEAGIALDPTLAVEGNFMATGGLHAARTLLARPKSERPTAIFAQSDLMAYGVMAAAAEFGLQIPKDLSLVGFDDNPSSSHMQPALTTVQQPCSAMGQQAIELLFKLIEKQHQYYQQPHDPKSQNFTACAPCIQLPTSLMIRGTCKKIPRRSAQTTRVIHKS